jgi:uncharacterized protein (TIGR03067 family)
MDLSKRKTPWVPVVTVSLFCWGIGTVSFDLSAGEDRTKTDHIGQWEIVSIKASSDKDTLFSRVAGIAFTKETKVRKETIPSRVVIETTDGRVLVFDYTLFLDKKPQAIDLIWEPTWPREPAQTFQGIYKVDGDSLQLCISTSNKDRPATFSLKEGTNQVLLVLQRKQNKAKAAGGPD